MLAERWTQIEQLYHAALERAEAERAAFLAAACASDEPLRREVEALLAAHAQAGSFLNVPALACATEELVSAAPAVCVGQQISHYRIIARLGAGGMGEVWLAEDTSLSRRVALKLLPAEFTADAERTQRFEQEARAASALNHPNIITVHEIGRANGAHYLVTEFVEGQTLRQRLAEGPLSAAQTLDIAVQVVAALQAAHGAGIIHRDIKPENVMLRPDGYVKVLDFGLAKLAGRTPRASEALSQMETLVAAQTAPGVILGTPRYMSPEQARGLKLDARSDIFSLGVLLYELLTGKPPFVGTTLSDVIAAILIATPPPLAEAAPDTPPELQGIIGQTLEKDPERRQPTAAELLSELRNCKAELEVSARLEHRLASEAHTHSAPPAASLTLAAWRAPQVWLPVALLLGVFGAALWWWQARRAAPAAPTIWPVTMLTNWRAGKGEGGIGASFSPDGKMLAFSGRRSGRSHLWLNQVGEDHLLQITKEEWDDEDPLWSPDGRYLAYLSERSGEKAIWRIPVIGGTPTLLGGAAGQTSLKLKRWSADGKTIYYHAQRQLFALDLASRQSRPITPSDSSGQRLLYASLAPDEQRIAYIDNQNGQSDLWVSRLDDTAPVRLTNDPAIDSDPVWHPDGQRIIYTSKRNGVDQICVAWLDGRPNQQLTFGESDYDVLDVVGTPASARILCNTRREESDLWRVKVATGQEQQLTSDLNFDLWPAVSPTGQALVFHSVILREPTQAINASKSRLVVQSLSDESQRHPLASGCLRSSWSPDGKRLAFLRVADQRRNLWTINANGGEEKRLTSRHVSLSSYTFLPYQFSQPQDYSWSRDNSRIAYVSQEQGRAQLRLVSATGEPDVLLLQSPTAGETFACPLWSPDGRRLAYLSTPNRISDAKKVGWGVWVMEPGDGPASLLFQPAVAVRLLGWSASGQDLWLAAHPGQILLTNELQPVQVFQLSLAEKRATLRFTLPEAYLYNLHLSPDARFIAATAQNKEHDSLWLLPVSGGTPRKVLENGEARVYFSDLAWSPDGREIYYGKQVSWNLLAMIEQFK